MLDGLSWWTELSWTELQVLTEVLLDITLGLSYHWTFSISNECCCAELQLDWVVMRHEFQVWMGGLVP